MDPERETVTVVKMDAQHRVRLAYPVEVVARRPHGVIVQAPWGFPARDLGCVRFEPGDWFTEHYYTDRWFNVQEVVRADGRRKGWYCDIAEPTVIAAEQIRLIDLELDVWVSAAGEAVVLDKDEFRASRELSAAQRAGARQGMRALLQLLEQRQDAFAGLRPPER